MRVAVLGVLLFLTACAHGFVAERLFCGLSIPEGGTVTQNDVDTFVAEVVESRFPEGFTVWRARGHWKGGYEDVLVIEIVHANNAEAARRIEEIANEYRRRFRQQAVLRVTAPVRMQIIPSR